jgi:murein DD-endopeptidase MepM/ murein hydrolase activator NlpD
MIYAICIYPPIYPLNVLRPYGNPAVEGENGPYPGALFAARRDLPVFAAQAGKVQVATSAGHLRTFILIEHKGTSGERYYTAYGLLDNAEVDPGDDVQPGQVIGWTGPRGLHFELRFENYSDPLYPYGQVDPEPFIINRPPGC